MQQTLPGEKAARARVPALQSFSKAHFHSLLRTSRGERAVDHAEAAVLRDWKHSRQKTGRPCVGRKGTVVCFPHPEQVA
jgi:hypothetical protein